MDTPEVIIAKKLVKSAGIGWKPNAGDIHDRMMNHIYMIWKLDLCNIDERWKAQHKAMLLIHNMKDYFQKVINSRKKQRSRKTNVSISK